MAGGPGNGPDGSCDRGSGHAEGGPQLVATAPPVLTRLHRWPASMPQYRVGPLTRVETIERCVAALPGLTLAGGAYSGVGIADCVHSGEAAAERTLS